MRERHALQPLHVVMIVIVTATLFAGGMLLSAAESQMPVDGAIEWSAESPLRAVVQLLCLNYAFPTIHAGDFKGYVLGLGAACALLALAVRLLLKPIGSDDSGGAGDAGAAWVVIEERPGAIAGGKAHVAPVFAAQVLFAAYVAWSFASSQWSVAPSLAVGASLLLLIQLVWSLALAFGLNPNAAQIAGRCFVIVSVLIALVAIWYYYGRNPTLRAKFPSGNPTFLAAILGPSLLLALGVGWDRLRRATSGGGARSLAAASACLVGAGLIGVTLSLTGSRGAMVGVVFGGLTMLFLGSRGRLRMVPLVLMLVMSLAGAWYLARAASTPSKTGRDVTLRVREYAWSYAWDLFLDKPLKGHGQGGYVLSADAKSLADVEKDPPVFEARIANAHNEWLQVLADLGSIGFVLIAASLLLTLWAGWLALSADPSSDRRWMLIALMGGLVAMIVTECFGVGLRVHDVPLFFYTMLGLVWASVSDRPERLLTRLTSHPGPRFGVGAVCLAGAFVVAVVSQRDFASARDAYRVDQALEKDDYEVAIGFAERAASNSLNPDRALSNRLRLARAYLRAAGRLQERARDREQRARVGELPDAAKLALADQDRSRCEEYLRAGAIAVKDLVLASPNHFNFGRVFYGLNLVGARLASDRGNTADRDRFFQAAAESIGQELLRQPFDPTLAADYVGLAGQNLPLPEVVRILARPLRYHRVTASYVELLSRMANDPEFEANFDRIRQAAEAHIAVPVWSRPSPVEEIWAPEQLRLAAAIRFTSGDYFEARRLLQVAAGEYDRLVADAALGAASCYAELADSCFFLEPTNPQVAIEHAQTVARIAPASLPGRQLVQTANFRLVDYHLASGEEAVAVRILRELLPRRTSTEVLNKELGARYARMCYSLLQRPAGGVLRQPASDVRAIMDRCVPRAIELNANDSLGHYLATDLAFQDGKDELAAEHLRRALRAGLNIGAAKEFLKVALDQKPDSATLRALNEEVEAAAQRLESESP